MLKKPYVENVEAGPDDDDEKVSAEAWKRHLMRNRSIIVDLFQVCSVGALFCCYGWACAFFFLPPLCLPFLSF